MKHLAMAALAGATILGSAAPAMAQSTDGPRVSLRLGLFLPTSSTTKDMAGKQWFSGGVDVYLADLNLGSTGNYRAGYGLSIDYQTKNDYRTIPILANFVGRVDNRLFYSVGAGIGINNTPDGDESEFAFQFGVGYDIFVEKSIPPVFAEIKYHGSSNSDLNGIGIYLGVRF